MAGGRRTLARWLRGVASRSRRAAVAAPRIRTKVRPSSAKHAARGVQLMRHVSRSGSCCARLLSPVALVVNGRAVSRLDVGRCLVRVLSAAAAVAAADVRLLIGLHGWHRSDAKQQFSPNRFRPGRASVRAAWYAVALGRRRSVCRRAPGRPGRRACGANSQRR